MRLWLPDCCFLLTAVPPSFDLLHPSRKITTHPLAVLALGSQLIACEPDVVAGRWSCPADTPAETALTADAAAGFEPVDLPWKTSFESGFCEYLWANGYCYGDPDSSHRIVDAPVHSGEHAAEFFVTADPSKTGKQTRCVRFGILPRHAVYGAWYYLESPSDGGTFAEPWVTPGNWNLMHFRTSESPSVGTHGMWDVSLENSSDGQLYLYVRGREGVVRATRPIPVPLETWFHIEFRYRRAADDTGEVALYQDGEPLLELTNLVTDDTMEFGQWFVGNLTDGVIPWDSRVYVDDVTLRPVP